MKLIDVTNSYGNMVSQQLANTDSTYVKVFSLGKTTVVYSEAKTHNEILLTNQTRGINEKEIEFVLERLAHKNKQEVKILTSERLAEISIPHDKTA